MKEILKKVYEAGYQHAREAMNLSALTPENMLSHQLIGQILNDPEFWRILGVPKGWHKYVDHREAGKDIESFFDELLK